MVTFGLDCEILLSAFARFWMLRWGRRCTGAAGLLEPGLRRWQSELLVSLG